MELPVLEIAQPRRKTLSDQSEEGKYMIARTSGIGKVLIDLQDGVVVEQAVENIGCLARDPPPVKWSAVMVRKRRIKDGEQATEAGRDCVEAAAG